MQAIASCRELAALRARPLRLLKLFGRGVLIGVLAASGFGGQTNRPPEKLDVRVERARAEKKGADRLNVLSSMANNLSLAEIPEAIQIAENLKSLREQLALRDAVIKRWSELAPGPAFAHVAALPEGLSKSEAIRNVAVAYARTDGRSAANAALKMKPGRARMEALSLIAETWARQEVNAALKWANDLPDPALKEMAQRSIYFVWVHSDPVAASAVVPKIRPGDTRNALLMNVASNWAATDPAAAIKWAKSLPEEADRDLALVIAVESWADSDPLSAVQFAMKQTPQLKQRAVLVALERWTTQDPQQAFEWIAKSPDPMLREEGIARVISSCASVCPKAARQWIDRLSEGPTRDAAIGAFVEIASGWDSEAAARLSLKTQEPAAREQRVQQCFRAWLQVDPESAKGWLKETNFSEEIKAQWRSQFAETKRDFGNP